MPLFMASTDNTHTGLPLESHEEQETRNAQLPLSNGLAKYSAPTAAAALASNPSSAVTGLEMLECVSIYSLYHYSCLSTNLSTFSLNHLKLSVSTSLSRTSFCLFKTELLLALLSAYSTGGRKSCSNLICHLHDFILLEHFPSSPAFSSTRVSAPVTPPKADASSP